jgi:hypothetical protein
MVGGGATLPVPPQPYNAVPHNYDASGGRKRRYGEVDTGHGGGGRGRGGGFPRAIRHKADEGHAWMDPSAQAPPPIPQAMPQARAHS